MRDKFLINIFKKLLKPCVWYFVAIPNRSYHVQFRKKNVRASLKIH